MTYNLVNCGGTLVLEVKLLIQNLVAKKLQVFSHCFHKPGDKLKSRIGISSNSNCLLFLLQENKRINTRFLEVISNFLKILKSKVKCWGINRRWMRFFFNLGNNTIKVGYRIG